MSVFSKRYWESRGALWTTPGVLRVFARCTLCGRVYPHWQACYTFGERTSPGCRCGNLKMQPTVLPWWRAAWWLLIRGWLWRKVVCKSRYWDPRLPILTERRTG